jgi:hypothetical protein
MGSLLFQQRRSAIARTVDIGRSKRKFPKIDRQAFLGTEDRGYFPCPRHGAAEGAK